MNNQCILEGKYMDDDWVERRNIVIKDYLQETHSRLMTEKDVLVMQIIEAHETENDNIELLDLDAFYDMELDDAIRFLERTHYQMELRINAKKREKANRMFDWDD